MAKIDKLVENYFSPLQKVSYDLLCEMVTNILEQEETNFEIAKKAVEEEGYEYEVMGKNIIKILHDERQIVLDKMRKKLEPVGFSYDPLKGGSLGRLQKQDRIAGSAYILFKPKSRTRAATRGMDFEKELADMIMTRYSDKNITAKTAGYGHGSDLTIGGPEVKEPLKIELKTALSADFGQFRVQFNLQANSWEPRRTRGYLQREAVFGELFDLFLKEYLNEYCTFEDLKDQRLNINKGKITGLLPSMATGDLKRELQARWFSGKTDYKTGFDFDKVAGYYGEKGDKFIQIGNHGLYALDYESAEKLGIKYFGDSGLQASLRFRLKPTMGENSATSFTIAIKLKGSLERSNLSLTREEDLDKIIQMII